MTGYLRLMAVVAVLAVVAGCGGETPDQGASAAGPGSWSIVTARIPAAGGSAICDLGTPPIPLSYCEWAHTIDALVVGKVIEVTGTEVPFLFDGELVTSGKCLGNLWVGLRIELERLEVLLGDVPAEVFEVHVGLGLHGHWIPHVHPVSSPGPVTWFGSEAPGFVEPLAEGSTLLLPITKEPTLGWWSLMRAPLSTLAGDGSVTGTQGVYCEQFPTPKLEGLLLAELAEKLAGCETEAPSDNALEARDQKLAGPGKPEDAFAGTCGLPGKEYDGSCKFQSECPSAHVCKQGKCVEVFSN